MDESRIDDIPQVSDEENTHTLLPYTGEEVKKFIFQIKYNKAPGGWLPS
jgi:hypothetical protein